MEIKKIRALRGPNLWGRSPALEIDVNLADAEVGATLEQLGLAPAVGGRCPGLVANCPEFRSWSLAQLLGRLCRFFQPDATSFALHSESRDWGRACTLVVGYREEAVARRAIEAARGFIEALRSDAPFALDETLASLREYDEEVRLGPSTGSIARAALARDIPIRRLNDASLVTLGQGALQRRILAAETDATSAIAESIAQDKELTKELLHAVGVPVPWGRRARDAEEAWEIARSLGGAVVVKPVDGNQGRGVAVGLTTRAQVEVAFVAAAKEGSSVLVERCAEGFDHRLLVIGGKVVAAARREVPQVVGDGVHTIRQLVERENRNPRRTDGHATSLSKLKLDAIGLTALSEQGLTPEAVAAPGVRVILRRNANLSTGGTAVDVTDEIHPELAACAVDAARAVGLDIAGVDVVCQDVRRPLEAQGGVVVEVNAAPGLRMHLEPTEGRGRPVGEAIVEMLFPHGETGRIPIIAVTGTNGKTTTTRLVASIQRAWGKRVGMTSTDGVYLDDERIATGDCSGPKSARNVLLHPFVEAAVLETARGGILREGLGFDRCDAAIVTNVGAGDHLGSRGLMTAAELARVKQTVVENVAPSGVAALNAEDPLVAAMAPFCSAPVIFFARDPETPALASHREQGGRAVFVDARGWIVTAIGDWERRLVPLASVPLTHGGLIDFQVENALSAVAACWGVGTPWEAIRQGLATFESDVKRVPGRFNVANHRGATVVIDYGHNTDAMKALIGAVGRFPHARSRALLSSAGDRRDDDIVKNAQLLADAFDEMILYEDACNRGRADGEVLALMRRGVEAGTRVRRLEEVRGEFKAIDLALDGVGPGDIVLLLIDQVDESLAYLEQKLESVA